METLNLTQKEGYVIVHINRGKANAINHELVNELRHTIRDLEADDSVRGVILTGIPRFFSAGLDLIELYGYDHNQMSNFFRDFGMMHVELARFGKPLVCAVTGHSPAGGTVIAITTDYRVMADDPKYAIGLNEVAVNVQISQNLVEAYAFWLGTSLANRYILAGKLLSPQEALNDHLVDEICHESEVLDRAEKKMRSFLKADPEIFKNSKAKLRKNWLSNISKKSEEELQEALDIWWKPEVRTKIKMLIESFTKKK